MSSIKVELTLETPEELKRLASVSDAFGTLHFLYADMLKLEKIYDTIHGTIQGKSDVQKRLESMKKCTLETLALGGYYPS